MTLRPETKKFLDDLTAFSHRTLVHGEVVGRLLEEARSRGAKQVFEDLVFLAKFLSKTFDLLRRIGPEGEGYVKVSAEFQSSMEKANALVKTIVKESDAPFKEEMVSRYLRLDPQSLEEFMGLMRDLAWVKNWTLDGKPLP